METILCSALPNSLPFSDASFVGKPKHRRRGKPTPTRTTASSIQRQNKSLHEKIFKPLHNLISSFATKNLPPHLDPNHILTGNFSPSAELPPTPCDVEIGPLPPCLDGAYIQNGPNPQFPPLPPYYYTDGDGMLHSLKISGGGATFCSRFVKTFKYETERDLGYPVLPNAVAFFISNLRASMLVTAARFMSFQFNPFADGIGPANTSLALVGGRLLALAETDLPYEIKITPDGDIETVGRRQFGGGGGGGKRFLTMTAHPKTDPETGETFAFRYFVTPPFLTFFRFDSDGIRQADVDIFSMNSASLVHDFAITESFAVFPDPQIVIDPLRILIGKPIMRADLGKTPRLGVIPRYAVDGKEMYWMEAPGLNIVHTVNAWEEDGGDKIVVVASNVLCVDRALSDLDRINLEKIVIDAAEKKIVGRYRVSRRNLDFGAINARYSGKKNRYVYAAVLESMPKMVGLVKLDLSLSDSGDCTVASRMYGPGCYGSEPVFVAREGAEEEDDGYLVAYVNNENTEESHFVVMDAKSPTLETVAAVKLPRRVPQGFHSIFVKQSDLLKM